MQCVILAAGEGKRLRPLTENTPKPLIKVCGKAILDYIVEALPDEIDELVIVTGYLEEQIKAYCGEEFMGRTVRYSHQPNFAGGTGDALLKAKDVISGKFLFMYSDDIHGRKALEKVVREDHAMLGRVSKTPELYGVLIQNEDGTLKEIIEKPENPTSNLVNIGGFVVDKSILDYEPPVSPSGELYVTDMLTAYAQDHPVKIIEQDLWLPIGYPEHISMAESVLSPKNLNN